MRNCAKGGDSMMNPAAANIFRKALALKPDGLEGVLNDLEPEELSLKNLGERLVRRRGYLQELSQALNQSDSNINKQSMLRVVQPLSETVNKIQTWLTEARKNLADLNRTVKEQNIMLATSISDFAQRNRNSFQIQNRHHDSGKVTFIKAVV